jgi:hypothetical protein
MKIKNLQLRDLRQDKRFSCNSYFYFVEDNLKIVEKVDRITSFSKIKFHKRKE